METRVNRVFTETDVRKIADGTKVGIKLELFSQGHVDAGKTASLFEIGGAKGKCGAESKIANTNELCNQRTGHEISSNAQCFPSSREIFWEILGNWPKIPARFFVRFAMDI